MLLILSVTSFIRTAALHLKFQLSKFKFCLGEPVPGSWHRACCLTVMADWDTWWNFLDSTPSLYAKENTSSSRSLKGCLIPLLHRTKNNPLTPTNIWLLSLVGKSTISTHSHRVSSRPAPIRDVNMTHRWTHPFQHNAIILCDAIKSRTLVWK